MTAFGVDLDELDRVVGSLDSFGRRFAAHLADLEKTISALQADWEGEAAAAQLVAHRKIAAGAEEMHTALIGLHRAARHAHGSYLGAVEANRATWRQVR